MNCRGANSEKREGAHKIAKARELKLLIDRRTLPFHRKKRVVCDVKEDTTKHPVGIVLGMPSKAMGDKGTVLVVSVNRI